MFGSQETDNKPKGAKQSLDVGAGFNRRQQQTISLRKDKRDKALEKRRRGVGTDETSETLVADQLNPMAYDQNSNPQSIPLELLPKFAEMVMHSDPQYAFHGTLMIRKLLSVEFSPPIDEVIASGVVPYFVSFMERDDFPQLQFESAWALTNVASGTREHTHLVMQGNAVPQFIRLLSSPSEDCREQATWAIGNLAGEGDKFRDYVLELGVMTPLLSLIMTPCDKITVLRNAVWALSNLCRGKPQPKLEAVSVALPVLASLLNHSDSEVIVDAAWAVSYISDGANDRIQAVLEAGVMARVVQLLNAPTTAMQTPAIRTIGNIATGNDRQTQVIINSGALPAMQFLLSHPKRAIRKETCWTISNITAGHKDQIQAVVNANLFPAVLQCTKAPEFEVKKEATWAIANTTSGGTHEQIHYLVDVNAIPPLCDLLTLFDPKIVTVALEAIQNILQVGEDDKVTRPDGANVYAQQVVECGGLDHIERLQTHTNSDVYQNALNILEAYFESEVTGDAAIPQTGSTFDFQPDNDQNPGGNDGQPQFMF